MLDEPTNDLDAESLELLEERLVEFDGTLLVVSHDRAFLNNVVTSTIAHEGQTWREYVGGYDDWVRQRRIEQEEPPKKRPAATTAKPVEVNTATTAEKKPKLSFKEQRELSSLPATIEQLESEIQAFHQLMAQPDFYQQPGPRIAEEQARLKSLEDRLATAYQRWEILEARGE